MVLLRPLPIRLVLRLIRLLLLLLAVPFSQHGVCKVSPFEYRVAIYLLPKEYKNYNYNHYYSCRNCQKLLFDVVD